MSRVNANRYSAVVGLLCVGLVTACGEPQCPGGFFKKGDTCYRIKDGGTQSTEAVEGDGGAITSDADDSPDVPGTSDADADTATADAAPAIDGGGQNDAAATDAGALTCASPPCGVESDGAADPCSPNPCGTGIDCTRTASATASCAAACASSGGCQPGDPCVTDTECRTGGSSTATCHPQDKVCVDVCGTQTIVSEANLDAARYCTEITGHLILQPNFATLPASALPYLTRVRGDVKGATSSEASTAISAITFGRLETVDGAFGLSGFMNLDLVSAPRLTTAGSFGFARSSVERISVPQLSRVNDSFTLAALENLTQVDIGKLDSIGGQVTLNVLCKLPWSQVERISTLGPTRNIIYVGCCIVLSRHASCMTSNHGCSCGG